MSITSTLRRLQRLEAVAPPLRMVRPAGLHGDAFVQFVIDQALADIQNRSMPDAEVRRRWHAWLDTLTREEDLSPLWDEEMARVKAELAMEGTRA
jgi:hypothetical protein